MRLLMLTFCALLSGAATGCPDNIIAAASQVPPSAVNHDSSFEYSTLTIPSGGTTAQLSFNAGIPSETTYSVLVLSPDDRYPFPHHNVNTVDFAAPVDETKGDRRSLLISLPDIPAGTSVHVATSLAGLSYHIDGGRLTRADVEIMPSVRVAAGDNVSCVFSMVQNGFGESFPRCASFGDLSAYTPESVNTSLMHWESDRRFEAGLASRFGGSVVAGTSRFALILEDMLEPQDTILLETGDVPAVSFLGRALADDLEAGTASTSYSRDPRPSVRKSENGDRVAVITDGDFGSDHLLMRDTLGSVHVQGDNAHGQLGITGISSSDDAQRLSLTGIIDVECGTDCSFALNWEGKVFAWGANDRGQLGLGDTSDRAEPTEITTLSQIRQISCYGDFVLALDMNGDVWAWGNGARGQLGQGNTNDLATPTQVSGLPEMKWVSAGEFHSLAIANDGRVFTWGASDTGQLGDGTTSDRSSPGETSIPLDAIQVAAGNAHSIALYANGDIYTWGSNSHGQLMRTIVDSDPIPGLATERSHELLE